MKLRIYFFLSALGLSASVHASSAQASSEFEAVRSTLHSMAGCYLVDYSFTEIESLKSGYAVDERVYDVNRDKSIKEWIIAEDVSSTRVRLQHILFGVGLDGQYLEGSLLKHQAEDWEYEAPFLYDFISPLHWDVKSLPAGGGHWTRRITNLDDGLRYQCAARWDLKGAYPEWSCSNYAPIPGRETRDMGRKDYQTLDRSTRIVNYGSNWLERQDNVKTIHKNGVREPLARELGKTWYVRLPDAECSVAQAFAKPRVSFWTIVRETWDEFFTGDRAFVELPTQAGQPSRYARMAALEQQALSADLSSEAARAPFRAELRKLISDFRGQ